MVDYDGIDEWPLGLAIAMWIASVSIGISLAAMVISVTR